MTQVEKKAIDSLKKYYHSKSNLQSYLPQTEFIEKVMKDAWSDTIQEIENNAKQGIKQNLDDVKKIFIKKSRSVKSLIIQQISSENIC